MNCKFCFDSLLLKIQHFTTDHNNIQNWKVFLGFSLSFWAFYMKVPYKVVPYKNTCIHWFFWLSLVHSLDILLFIRKTIEPNVGFEIHIDRQRKKTRKVLYGHFWPNFKLPWWHIYQPLNGLSRNHWQFTRVLIEKYNVLAVDR